MKYLNTMVTGTHKALAKHALGTADLKSVGTSTVQEAGKLSTSTADGAATAIDIASTTTTINQSKNQFNLGVVIGGQYAFDGFYVALEAGAAFTPEKMEIQQISVDGKAATTHAVGTKQNTSISYAEAVKGNAHDISLSEKYSFHATPIVGFSVGSWVFYVPFVLKYTKYELSFTPNTGTTAPTSLMISANEVTGTDTQKTVTTGATEIKLLKGDSEVSGATSEQKKEKNEFLFEIGAGVRFMVSDSVFVGVRYTFQPKKEMEFDEFSGYKTTFAHDALSLGAKHKITTYSHKGELQFGFVF
ncbi:MAG: hypothetical protein LBI26_02020, partial [Holosporales bacterium]|jgi:opacity protein-like surface antigen|nr:hypothetical protein [Holosporales bacterium]